MKFIADVMLGRLSKRLRMLGFDVLYDRTFTNREIIHFSLEQQRVILTRDMALAKRPLATYHCFIKSDNVRDQIKQVLAEFSRFECSAPFTRCSVCNELLVSITKHDVQDLIPQYVYEKNNEFSRCPQCERTYWKGTHVK